jgi:hypothetical protein
MIGGFANDFETYRYLTHFDPRFLIMPARVVSLVLLIGTGVVLARFCWSRYGAFASFFVFTLLMISPAFFEYGSYGLPDISVMFFSVVSLVFTAKYLEANEKSGLINKHLILAAVFSGLAISTKYSALSTVVPIGFSIFYLYFMQRVELKRAILLVALAAGACILAFLLGSPGWVLKPQVFMSGLEAEINHVKRGHVGYSGVPILGNLELLIVAAPVITASSILGFLLWVKNRDSVGWVALVAVVSAVALAAGSTKQSLHYMYPAFAGLLIFSSVLGKQFGQLNRVVVSVVVVLAIFIPFINVSKESLNYLNDNTTLLATKWMYDNIPENSKVARGWAYVPKVYTQKKLEQLQRREPSIISEKLMTMYKAYDVKKFKARKKWLEETDAEFIVTSESVYKRFFDFGMFTRTYPSKDLPIYRDFQLRKEFYETLFNSAEWEEVFVVNTGNGPSTHVYQRRNAS